MGNGPKSCVGPRALCVPNRGEKTSNQLTLKKLQFLYFIGMRNFLGTILRNFWKDFEKSPSPLVFFSKLKQINSSLAELKKKSHCTQLPSIMHLGNHQITPFLIPLKSSVRAKSILEYNTTGSRVIPDLSTNAAWSCLTAQIGRDTVFSA